MPVSAMPVSGSNYAQSEAELHNNQALGGGVCVSESRKGGLRQMEESGWNAGGLKSFEVG